MNRYTRVGQFSLWTCRAMACGSAATRRRFSLIALMGVALCLTGCGEPGTGQEEVATAARVIEIPTQEEMIEEIRSLPRYEGLSGKCIGATGEGSAELLAYVAVARKAGAMPYSELFELYEKVYEISLYDGDAKMHLLSRLIYDVPDSFQYSGTNVRDVVFMLITPVDGYEINYLFPFEIDAHDRLCVKRDYYRYMYSSGANARRAHTELSHFEENFPRRDLSTYLSGLDQVHGGGE